MYTFTVELVKGGNVFRGGRIRWCVQYVDAKNYLLFELDKKNFWAEVIEKGKKLERAKTPARSGKAEGIHHSDRNHAGHVCIASRTRRQCGSLLDSFAEPGRNFTKGKFGFLIQGNDEIGISDFKFKPR